MPGFDRTGPMGHGPGTGGGFGYCSPSADENVRGTASYGVGRGGIPCGGGRGFAFGGGRSAWQGLGHGLRCGRFGQFVQAPVVDGIPAEQEITLLREQSSALQHELAQIQERLDALTAEKDT
ncbi:hypothetical protein CSA56_18850 [candidate division KSB3 bacterium]|uniref:DUF5320 domain-containing protein n=1 Tax=candidate division KSB3 bacterium TaxID=2044937 RepID=A0A2G6K787_9BACT|nr:MAG: hypothetical protein CSA56_18850 [candidate division KSB3 bacterium]